MTKRFNGKIDIDGRDSTPDWQPYVQPVAPEGSASVLYIILEDAAISTSISRWKHSR